MVILHKILGLTDVIQISSVLAKIEISDNVKPPRPEGRGFCITAALRTRAASWPRDNNPTLTIPDILYSQFPISCANASLKHLIKSFFSM
jgi:hypothetical protein